MNITVNQVELFYEVVGSGDPLVMVHGNGEDHTIFDKAVELLSPHFTCYLLASRHPGLLDKMIVSGANTRPDAVRKWLRVVFKIINRLHQNPLFTLMLTEPHISGEQLQAITTPTLVLAGSKDLVVEADTRFIAEHIPHATLQILEGEGHASYIVHQTKVAELILAYCGNH